MHIPYDDSFIHELFPMWEAIMAQWDDKKSHEVHDAHFSVLLQASQNLVDLSRDIQIEINRIAEESDAIY